MMNIVNGGAHSDAPIDFQEFMIMPKDFPTFSEALRAGVEIFHALKAELKKRGLSTAIGDEGGFAPAFSSAEDALDSIANAVKAAGYKFGKQVFIALDAAASEFYDSAKKSYVFKKSDGSKRSSEEMVDLYKKLCGKYPIVSIEDGCSEHDWEGWKLLTDALGDKVQLVGDDLFVTNVSFLRKGIDKGVANSILVKVNQIGSLTETLDAIELAKRTNTPLSLAIALAKPRIPQYLTSLSQRMLDRLRPVLYVALIASPNITNSFASRRSLEPTPFTVERCAETTQDPFPQSHGITAQAGDEKIIPVPLGASVLLW